MAVKYKEIKAQVETPELSKEEIKAIEQIEEYIDKRINEEFDN
jgi:hypothetical protein